MEKKKHTDSEVKAIALAAFELWSVRKLVGSPITFSKAMDIVLRLMED